MAAHRLPSPIQRRVEDLALTLMSADGMSVDFANPKGAPALAGPDSVSWRVFKNPVALFTGGVAAVLLELAEPRVRAGVWDHTRFRTEPVTRLKRTGLAAMVTVYAARATAEAMIAGVGRRHAQVSGITLDGTPYRADDPELLDWVQATASFGFLNGYHHYVRPLSGSDRDRFYAEAAPAAALYGARNSPVSEAGFDQALGEMTPRLERSEVLLEFLDIIRKAPALPPGVRVLQPMLVRAAVDLLPMDIRNRLGLGSRHGLAGWERRVVKAMGQAADGFVLTSAPPAQACVRLGLPADFLYRNSEALAA